MGLYLVEAGDMLMRIRRRYRSSRHKTTFLGVVFMIAAAVMMYIASSLSKKRKNGNTETSEAIEVVAFVLGIVFFVLSCIADLVGDDK